MEIGLFAPLVSPIADRAYLTTLGRTADDRGFHSIWFGEHVVVVDESRSRYPWSEDGRMPAVFGDRGLPELFTTLAFLAACTERVELGSGACILPMRNPVLTAKEAANIDWLTGGRFNLGVGLGWLEEEFDAMGASWAERGARSRSYLELITTLWRDEIASYRSPYYELPPVRLDPKPVRPGGLPIYIAGDNRRAFERLADFGQGWYALSLRPDEIAQRLQIIEPLLHERGRSISEIDVMLCPYTLGDRVEDVAAYRDAGVTQLLVTVLAKDPDQLVRKIDRATVFLDAAAELTSSP